VHNPEMLQHIANMGDCKRILFVIEHNNSLGDSLSVLTTARYSSYQIRRMRWARHVARMEECLQGFGRETGWKVTT
jgi:hypothetical protein